MQPPQAAALLLLGLLAATLAAASDDATCRLHGIRTFQRKADLPGGAAAALGFPMAERGAPFQATDVIGPGPRLPGARFVAARQTDCRLVIRYERGGIAHTWETAILELRGNRWVAGARVR